MKAVEKFCSKEPQWILDKTGTGLLFWRRDSCENNSRVKFRYEVDVREFHRDACEIEHVNIWYEQGSDFLTTAISVVFCVTVTVILPWFIFGRKY